MDIGFYHADPHPGESGGSGGSYAIGFLTHLMLCPFSGNLLKMPDGRFAYLDFGMMGQIDAPVRDALVSPASTFCPGGFFRLPLQPLQVVTDPIGLKSCVYAPPLPGPGHLTPGEPGV